MVRRLNKDTFCKELLVLVEIGVINPIQKLDYGTPILIILKNESTVRFIKYYQKFHYKIMMNPYTFTRTGDTMQQLPGFHYAASLELNIGYYIIEISPKI